jgi:flagellar motility protein MotE (MotC chaperone)
MFAALLLIGAAEPEGGTGAEHTEPVVAAVSEEDALEAEVRKHALALLEADADAKLAELARLREELEGQLEPAEVASARDLETLIDFYQAMKPKKAAVLLEKLPAELAAEVLGAMKSRQAGKVLDAMQPAPAVRISKMMAGKRR